MTNVEIWKDIPNYEGLYQVSNYGKVRNVRNNPKLLKPKLNNATGYYQLALFKNSLGKSFRIHQLVSICFLEHIPCKHKIVVNHKNFVRTDNRVDNLELITQRQNTNQKHRPHSSIYTGVSWHNLSNKWKSGIRVNNKNKNLGYFNNEYQAHLAYQKALVELSLK